MSDQCVFCGIVAGEVPHTKVFEDENTYAFMDIHPASDGTYWSSPSGTAKTWWRSPPRT